MTSTDWTTRAACAGRLDLPWTADTADLGPWEALTMRAVCDSCPVLLDCLAAIDALDVTGGFWAGHDRDPDAAEPLPAPDWATAETEPSAPAPAHEPVVCWHPRRGRHGGYEQGAYVLQRDDAGSWHLGGVAS